MTHPCKSVYINSCQICDVGFTLYVNFTQIVIMKQGLRWVFVNITNIKEGSH